ncbi:MAG: insulinase family protein [Anaerolineae bacterium]|nr:insulinase family protein [Anaerolineae bacterium]
MTNARYPDSQTITRHTLPNGLTILAYENFASPSVVIEGLVRVGALAESRETAGLANFTAVSLMRGTQNRTFDQIYEALESAGADLSFSGAFHTSGFSAQGLVEDFGLLLDMVAGAWRTPTFPPEQIVKVQGQLLTGLQMRTNDTGRMANLAFHELVYDGHPYGRSASGYPETVSRLTPADLTAFHAQHYGPQGAIIVVVGAVKAEEAIAQVTAVLGDWHNERQQVSTAVADMPRPGTLLRTHVNMPDKHQADIRLGLPGPRRAAPDYLEASLMNTILGVFGMMGRIGLRVREEEGLAYYAYSQLQGGLGPSPWLAAAGVAPEAVEQAITSILDEVARIQNEPVSAEELADSQAYRIGSMPMALETNSGLADIIGDMEFYELGLDYLAEYAARIQAITPADIQATAQKYLSTEQLGTAVAGPELVSSER